MEMFTPSFDWGNVVVDSVVWVTKAWAISAFIMLAVLVLVARFTTWGRQFWRVTGAYFKGRQSIPVWGLLAVLLLSVMISVRMDVLFSYYLNDQTSAIQVALGGREAGNAAVQASGESGFYATLVLFALLLIADGVLLYRRVERHFSVGAA